MTPGAAIPLPDRVSSIPPVNGARTTHRPSRPVEAREWVPDRQFDRQFGPQLDAPRPRSKRVGALRMSDAWGGRRVRTRRVLRGRTRVRTRAAAPGTLRGWRMILRPSCSGSCWRRSCRRQCRRPPRRSRRQLAFSSSKALRNVRCLGGERVCWASRHALTSTRIRVTRLQPRSERQRWTAVWEPQARGALQLAVPQ
jgi:hypothetical protein